MRREDKNDWDEGDLRDDLNYASSTPGLFEDNNVDQSS